MKRTLYVLLLAIPMVLSGCDKEDIDSTSVPPQYIDFARINSWIGSSVDNVDNELLQLGFVKEDGYDNYTYLSEEPYYFVSCGTFSTDGIVQGANTQYITNADSYSITFEVFKDCVRQERQLFNDNNLEYSSGKIRWVNTDDDEDHTENHDSYEALLSAAAGISDKRYVELDWTDYYSDRTAFTRTYYDNRGLQGITMVVEKRQ